MAEIFVKEANAVLDYQENWATWLDSDTISSSSWSADSGITVDSDSNTTTTATVWLSGGTAGNTYAVTNQIVTAAARTNERIIYIMIPAGASSYITPAMLREYLGISASGDDDLLLTFINSAQAFIDDYTGKTFVATADTAKTFDAVSDVGGTRLYVDDLCAITSITNGDGTTVTSDQYTTEPRRVTPYYAIKLLASSNVSWTYTTDPEDAISITGRWAYSTTPPNAVKQACLRLSAWLYRQKDTNADIDRPLMTGDGAVIMPSSIPSDVRAILNPYRRMS